MSVEFTDVTFRYPGSADPALSNVSIALGERGSITVLTGALGAGCSTLLLVAAGLAPHVTGGDLQGAVRTLGENGTTKDGRASLAGRVGTLLATPWTQLSGMSFTVWEEIAFGPANLGWTRDRIDGAVDRALATFDIARLAERDPRTLSGGELQLVMFAAVAAMEPVLLLLDEPVQELDPRRSDQVYAEVLPTLAEQAGIVIATTNVDRAVDVADRVLVLDNGRILADGDPAPILGGSTMVAGGRSTTAARIARDAGFSEPYPLTVDALIQRVVS